MPATIAAPGARAWRRVCGGVGSAALGQALQALQAIVSVPFFLRAWGEVGYGRWLTLTALISYLNLLDLGGQNHFANLMAISKGRGDAKGFSDRLSEGVSAFAGIGICSFGIVVGLLFLFLHLPIPGLGRRLQKWEAWVMLWLSVNYLLVTIPGAVYAASFRASGLFALGAMVNNLCLLVGLLFSLELLYLAVDPQAYAGGLLAVGLFNSAAILFVTRRRIPETQCLRISLADARGGMAHRSGALWFWLISLAQAAMNQGLIMVLAMTTKPLAVALYATHRTVANMSGYAGALLQGPLLPELSFLWAQNRLPELRQTSFLTVRVLVFAVGLAGIGIWLAAPLTYPVWARRRLQLNELLLVVLLVQGVLAAGWSTSSWCVLATNHHRQVAIWSLGNAAITLALGFWLSRTHGVMGAALASLAGDLICGLVTFPLITARFLKISAAALYWQMCEPILELLPFLIIAIAVRLFPGWSSVLLFAVSALTLGYLMCALFPWSTGRAVLRLLGVELGGAPNDTV